MSILTPQILVLPHHKKYRAIDLAHCPPRPLHVVQRRSEIAEQFAALLLALKKWKIACPKPPDGKGLVFPNTQGGFERHYNLLRRGFFPALRRAGLRRIRFHDLRHTCASLLLASGVNIKQVQSQLGHASVNITLDVYSHLLPDADSPGAQVFEKLLNDDRGSAASGSLP